MEKIKEQLYENSYGTGSTAEAITYNLKFDIIKYNMPEINLKKITITAVKNPKRKSWKNYIVRYYR